jgi:glycosyltransferase involved in cell wall biosynthesis
MPVYNQEAILVKNLRSVLEMTQGPFEVLLILDYCFDRSEQVLLDFLESYTPPSHLVQITVFKTTEPLFETKCDNIGFRHAMGTYCLEIQADMEMTELGYNLHMTKPFQRLPNVIAVSGRCAHNVFTDMGVGKLGPSVEQTIAELGFNRNQFYVLETCNRGPLLLHRKRLAELDYLDEENYFLDNSDHDLMIRAYLKKGYICGYVPIDYTSPLSTGSMRNTNTYNNCKEYQVNHAAKERLKQTCRSDLEHYRSVWVARGPRTYPI